MAHSGCISVCPASFIPVIDPYSTKVSLLSHISPLHMTSHHGLPGSLVGQSVWDLWWTEWHWATFFSECFIFPYQYYSTNAPHPFIYLTLTLYDLSNCHCCEMKCPSKMYKMRLKNPSELGTSSHPKFSMLQLEIYLLHVTGC